MPQVGIEVRKIKLNYMDKDLTQKLRTRMNSSSRIRGRYNVSDLSYINNGLMTPEEWLKPKQKDVEELVINLSIAGTYNQIKDLLKGDFFEEKAESVYEGITLVGRCDLLNASWNEVWGIKVDTKHTIMHETYKLKIYCSMFQKDVGLLYQPVSDKDGFYLKNISKVERDDVWFGKEMEKLQTFNKEVEKLWIKMK